MKRKFGVGFALLLISAALLVGCNISIASYFNSSTASMTGRYAYYSGTKSKGIELVAGQELQLTYNCKVSKGSLDLSIIDPSGAVVWQRQLTKDANETLTYSAKDAGLHKVVLVAEGAGGSFDIKWSTKR